MYIFYGNIYSPNFSFEKALFKFWKYIVPCPCTNPVSGSYILVVITFSLTGISLMCSRLFLVFLPSFQIAGIKTEAITGAHCTKEDILHWTSYRKFSECLNRKRARYFSHFSCFYFEVEFSFRQESFFKLTEIFRQLKKNFTGPSRFVIFQKRVMRKCRWITRMKKLRRTRTKYFSKGGRIGSLQ